jgi:predicted nicotinamide N-methyase
VLATDWAEEALELLRTNAGRNGIALETARLAWQEPQLAGGFDLVLAADVLYEQRNVPQLLALLPRLGAEVLIAEPGRPAAKSFFEQAAALWQVEETADRVFRLTSRPSAPSSRAARGGPA